MVPPDDKITLADLRHREPIHLHSRPKIERLWRTGAPNHDGPWGLVTLNPVGFRCGYVHAPDWQGTTDRLSAHGGITFVGDFGPDDFDNGDGVPDGVWLGFDCAHAGDAPEPGYWEAATGHAYPMPGHVWQHEEVVAAVEFLAGQVMGGS